MRRKLKKPKLPAYKRLGQMDEQMTKLLGVENTEQETPKPGDRDKQMIKQDAIDAATIMFNNLDPQCHCTDEYDLICETLEELAK